MIYYVYYRTDHARTTSILVVYMWIRHVHITCSTCGSDMFTDMWIRYVNKSDNNNHNIKNNRYSLDGIDDRATSLHRMLKSSNMKSGPHLRCPLPERAGAVARIQ